MGINDLRRQQPVEQAPDVPGSDLRYHRATSHR
jgi:hypothetical protein